IQKLNEILPLCWNGTNPVHVLRDADVERFSRTARLCLGDPSVDGVLIIYTPQGAAKPDELARAVIDIEAGSWKPVIAACMGGKDAREGRDILCCKNIPVYGTPEEAVRTYLYMYNYKRNLGLLYETPGELSIDKAPPKNNLKAFIRRAIKKEWDVLSEDQSRRFLNAYGIPAMNIRIVKGVEEAVIAAGEIGYPVVLKIASPDIIYRIDVGGVITNIGTEAEQRQEYVRLLDGVKQNASDARIEGVIVQKMLEKIDYEVILGAKKDSEFGSVIMFGMGGVGVEIFRDFSVGLPPLNQTLARRLMEETKVYKMLKGHRGRPPADLRQIEEIIVSFSNLIVDFPEIAEMDINPIAVSNGRACALDARILIDRSALDQPALYPHLVITPYPAKYVTTWALPDNTEILFRPIRPEDEPLEHEMLSTLSEDTMRARFFQAIKSISHEMLVRFCNIDYDRELAIVAEVKIGEKRKIAAIGRLLMDSDFKSGEYAVLVHDDYQGKGLGYKLGDIFIGIAHDRGLEEIYGYVQRTNSRMIKVFKKLGFTMEKAPDQMDMAKLKLALK
ncbi:MAG TPA: GNAT family N-acetyltransferase, partial [Nitrospiria bacterium]|nr:GNAT family N-acetyltransferase [Nitrospiria bacterium]